jgi:hypothetical protein
MDMILRRPLLEILCHNLRLALLLPEQHVVHLEQF